MLDIYQRAYSVNCISISNSEKIAVILIYYMTISVEYIDTREMFNLVIQKVVVEVYESRRGE